MLNALTSLPSTGALEVLRIAAIWWLRSGLILLFALWVLRRSGKASAATRHALLAVALISSLALPGLSLVLPSWSLPIAPSWWPGGSVMSSPSARPIAPLGAESAFSFVSVEDPTVSATVIPTPEATDVESAASHRSDGQSGLTVAGPAESILATKGLVPVTVRSLSVLPSEPGFDWVPAVSLALLLLWGGGVALRCGGRLLSLKSRRRLRRTAQDAEPALVSVLDGVREELGIRRTVRLSMSSSIDIPITWGTWRPIVLLPAAANGWAPQRLQHILLHELSHVRRCDGLVQATVWLVVTLRWFDPLAWYAAARLRIEAERACDDNVLLAGGRPAVYAGHLLEIARAASFHGLGAAVAMAQTKSSLSSRVEAILDRGLVRHSTGVRRHSVIAVLGLALVAVVASAAVRPERPPKPPERPEPLGPVVLAPPVQPQTVASPAPAPPAPLTARPPVGASLSAVPVPEAHPGRG
ncbi:MAG: M56 family metallopeptidase, partial [Thermoanaerobaculia bacterium]|nr:M56 family metallopeptidase [Thermoanaerobaculia bacterium]